MTSKRRLVPLLIIISLSCFILGLVVASMLNFTPSSVAVDSQQKEGRTDLPEVQIISPNTFVNIAKRLNPTVVYISSTQVIKGFQNFHPPLKDPFRDFFGDDFFDKFFGIPKEGLKQKSLGSGFIIDEKGYILTNNHVVRDAEDIFVTLSDNNEYKAKIIGKDEDMDVALLKIEAKENLPIAKLGDSDALQIGEWVVAIGNPFGLEHTVTAGIVSAKWRTIGQGPYNSFIQTDASINPGNSGGPLFNIKGEVVGINTAIISEGQGIGFAIPINMVSDVLEDLKNEGKIRRGWLGLMIQKVTPDLAKSFGLKENKGALVAEVVEGSPADKAGIKSGDVITKFKGKEIREYTDLSRYAGLTRPDTKVEIELIRDGKIMELNVKIGEFEDGEKSRLAKEEESALGMRLQNITPELAKHFNLGQSKGVLVTDVKPDSPADKAGVQRGDIIIEVNRKKVENIKEFDKAIKTSGKETVLLLINREERPLYIAIGR
ncbi:DegQ family serine endoprotease [bacterium]|nr:DegQ family serine endoprotease [bacterium]